MKKHLVIIAGSCYPISSANGSIALSCAKYLHDEYDISVISKKHYKQKESSRKFSYGTMYFVKQLRYSLYQKYSVLVKEKSKYLRGFYWILLFLVRVVGYLESLFIHIDNMWWFKKAVLKKLNKINNEKKIDAILSFSMPIESHLAANCFKEKHREVIWATYWADEFATISNKKNLFISYEKMIEMEQDIISKSDIVFTTEELYEVISSKYPSYYKKIVAVPYLLSEDALNIPQKIKNESIKSVIYMGAFYKNIRNPEYMLKVFSEEKLRDVKLDLYITGDCDDIVNRYISTSDKKITSHAVVPKSKLYEIIKDVDILVNVDNINCKGKPSKLYELISFRKPIINFSYSNELGELDKYPYNVNLCMNDPVEVSVEKLNKFLDSYDTMMEISPEEIRKIFFKHTEKNVKNLIVNAFLNVELKG